jgi:hypothetical protein
MGRGGGRGGSGGPLEGGGGIGGNLERRVGVEWVGEVAGRSREGGVRRGDTDWGRKGDFRSPAPLATESWVFTEEDDDDEEDFDVEGCSGDFRECDA